MSRNDERPVEKAEAIVGRKAPGGMKAGGREIGPTARRSVASSAAWSAWAQICPLAVNIILTPFVIRHLGETRYGFWLVSSAIAAFVGQFDGGVYRTALRWFAVGTRGAGRIPCAVVFTSQLFIVGLSVLTILPVILHPKPIAHFFHAPEELISEVELLLRVLAAVVAVGLIRGVFGAALHSHMQFQRTALATIAGYFAYAAAMYYTLSSGMDLSGVAVAYVAQTTVTTVLILCWALPRIDFSRPWLLPWSEAGAFGRTAWRVQVASLLTALSQQTALLLVGRLSPQDVASFGPGSTFAQNFRALLWNAIAPIQSRFATGVGRDGLAVASALAATVQRLWVRGVVGVVAVGAPAAYFGVNAWLPLGGDLAGLTAAVLLTAHGIGLLAQVSYQWNMAADRPGVEMRAVGFALVVMIVCSLALVPLIGAIGVGVASVLGNALSLGYTSWTVRRLAMPLQAPVRDVPWAAATLAFSATVVLEAAWVRVALDAQPLHEGPLGLIVAGIVASPVLAVYSMHAFGWRKVTDRLVAASTPLRRLRRRTAEDEGE